MTPRLLGSVLGPAPFPLVLASASVPAGVVATALVGRWATGLRGTRPARLARIALWTGLAYVGAVTISVIGMSLAEQGPAPLAFPFLLLANGLTVAILLAPWAALPALATALVLERWTRQPLHVAP